MGFSDDVYIAGDALISGNRVGTYKEYSARVFVVPLRALDISVFLILIFLFCSQFM